MVNTSRIVVCRRARGFLTFGPRRASVRRYALKPEEDHMFTRLPSAGPRFAALILASTLLAVLAGPVASQADIEGLQEAVDFYHANATSDLKTIHEATHRLEAIAMAHPVGEDNDGAWLPAYWTSFTYTQLALFARDWRSGPYAELAEYYLVRAKSEKPDEGPSMDADFHALEAMVLSFKGRGEPDNKETYDAQSEEAWSRARAADPENPMVLMNQGLALIADPDTRAEAYEILDRAIEAYEPRMGTVTPNWGREFIDAWMGNYPRPDGLRRAISPSEWTMILDRQNGGDPPRLEVIDGAVDIRTGAAAIFVDEGITATGDYRIEVDFTQFDPERRNEGFGVVFGGLNLDTPERQYDYLLIRQDGAVLLKRRIGQSTPVVRDWTVHPALNTWAERDTGAEHITNRIELEVDHREVVATANGSEVLRVPREELGASGAVGLRVNHGLHIRVERFVVNPLG